MALQWQRPLPEAHANGARVSADGIHCSCPSTDTDSSVRGLHVLPATGVTSWRLLVESTEGSPLFGICSKQFKSFNEDPYAKKGAWLVGEDGAVCQDKKLEDNYVQCDGQVLDMKVGDVLEFIFNADSRTLSLEIEGTHVFPSPLFTNLPKRDFYPIVSCESVRSMHPKKRKGHALERLAKYARKSWDNRKFCDVDIICSDRRIPCHRTTLAAVSSVFSSMFESGMREGVDREVRVDEPGDAVEALVEFMYTGDLREVEDLGAVLLLADKYDVQELLDVVLETMVQQASPATIVSSLRALKPLLDRQQIAEVFDQLLRSVQGSNEITEMMRTVAMAL